jgi:hypothetical protein
VLGLLGELLGDLFVIVAVHSLVQLEVKPGEHLNEGLDRRILFESLSLKPAGMLLRSSGLSKIGPDHLGFR